MPDRKDHQEDHTRAPRLSGLLPLAGSGAVLAALYVWLYHSGSTPPTVQDRVIAYPVIFAIYLFSVWWIWHLREQPGRRPRFAAVILASVALHAIVLSGVAPKNPDLDRHLWEGRVLVAGHNPYAAAPEAPIYDDLRAQLEAEGDDLWSGYWLKHKQIRSVYGPVSTALWAVPHLLPINRVCALRIIMTLCSLGTVALLVALLTTLGHPRALVIVYAWSPVCINGFADRGQIDAAMVLLVVLAALLVARGRFAWAGIAMAAAVLTKLWPLLLALPMLRMGGRRFAAGFGLAVLAGVLPFAGAGPEALEGLGAFADRWHANDSVFTLVLMAAEALHVPQAARVARSIVALLAVAYTVWRTWRLEPDDVGGLPGVLAGISAAVIILSPVTYPWYAAPMIAFLCFAPVAWMLALSLAPMLWYLRFLKGDPGTVWAALARWGDKPPQLWRLPAYAVVYLMAAVRWVQRGGPRPSS
ncbi:MAG: glycosyltransferase 87 family protein [Armatimonadota bacterium]